MTGSIFESELNTARLLFLNTLINSSECEFPIMMDVETGYFQSVGRALAGVRPHVNCLLHLFYAVERSTQVSIRGQGFGGSLR